MITIHKATVEDAEGILNVHRQSWLSTYPNPEKGVTQEDVEYHITTLSLERWQYHVTRMGTPGAQSVWVAKDGDKVVGFCTASKDGEMSHLKAIYILKEHQRLGVGKLLMKKALDWLGSEKDIDVHVVRYNDQAIKFYQSQGFLIIGDDEEKDWFHFPSGNIMKGTVMLKKKE